jgi:hypothetical protein
LKLPVPRRRSVVAELAGEGMSNRAIADVIGVDKNTVRADLLRGENSPPAEVTRQDGKTYARPEPKPVEPVEVVDAEIVDEPTPTPQRKPLVDSAGEIRLDLAKLERRIRKLITDDRLARNRPALVGTRNELIRFRELCDEAINAMWSPGGDTR